MRGLTASEARVIGALLASETISERERARRTGLPIRTYQTARRRIIAAGWVCERYVPNPIRLGRPFLQLHVVHPFADKHDELARRLRDAPGTVVLWQSRQQVFSLRWLESARPDFGTPESFADLAGRAYSLTVDLRRPTVPAYFDFGGLWGRWTEARPSGSYPHSLPRDLGLSSEAQIGKAEVDKVGELVSGHSETSPVGGSLLRLIGPSRASSARKLGGQGLVEHRYFLEPSEVPRLGGSALQDVVFIHGELREQHTPDVLFRELVEKAGVSPFLFVTDDQEAFLGTLSVRSTEPTQAPRTVGPSVVGILGRHLENIEILRDPLLGTVPVLNHRYDRLFAGPGASSRAGSE